MTKDTNRFRNHYCLATPLAPRTATPAPSYERPIPPPATEAVRPCPRAPGQRPLPAPPLSDHQKSELLISGQEVQRPQQPPWVDYNQATYEEAIVKHDHAKVHDDLEDGDEIYRVRRDLYDGTLVELLTHDYEGHPKLQEGLASQVCKDSPGGEAAGFYQRLMKLKEENEGYLAWCSTAFERRSGLEHGILSSGFDRTDNGGNMEEIKTLEVPSHGLDGEHVWRRSDTHNGSQQPPRSEDVEEESALSCYQGDAVQQFNVEKFKGTSQALGERKEAADERSPPIRPKVFQPTVPQPFLMTVREEQKQRDKAQLEQMDVDRNDQSNIRIDDSGSTPKNIKIGFKAKPVPKHVKEPLFARMVEAQPNRYGSGFVNRNIRRSQSEGNLSNGFKAREFPREIFTDFANERMREEVSYRNVRKALRQKQLLSESHWPSRMEQSILLLNQSVKADLQKIGKRRRRMSQDESFHKRPLKADYVAGKVPDFNWLHKKFLEDLEQSKCSALTTVTVPFSFDESIKKWQESRNKPMRPKAAIIISQKPFCRSEGTHRSPPSSPGQSSSITRAVLRSTGNHASMLRTSNARELLDRAKRSFRDQQRRDLEKELRQLELRKSNPVWSQVGQSLVLQSRLDEKKRQRMEQGRERELEYRLELDSINKRVKSRPTLFQSIGQLENVSSIEKKYSDVLRREGLREEDIVEGASS